MISQKISSLEPASPISPKHEDPASYCSFQDRKKTPSKKPSRHGSPVSVTKDNSTQNTFNIIRPKKTSLLSVSPKPRRYSNLQKSESSSRSDSVGPSNGSTVQEEVTSRYQCIASITEQQNVNLKEQNSYLLEKLRKMKERQNKMKNVYEKAKKYKALWEEADLQIQLLKDECLIYKEQAEQMKKIVLNDVFILKQKVLQTEIETEQSQTDFTPEVGLRLAKGTDSYGESNEDLSCLK